MAEKNLAAQSAEAARRQRELRKCLKDVYYLAKKYLGYDLLTDWHEIRLRKLDQLRQEKFVLWLAPRGHYKTTVEIAEICQDILRDPDKCHLVCHAVEEEVQNIVEEVAHHFTHNKEFRWLKPEIMPEYEDGKFFKKSPSAQFTVRRNTFSRQPTLRGKSAGSEITGSHINGRIWLDDIIGEKDLDSSTAMAEKRKWYRATVSNVLMPEGQVRARGTRWDLNDCWDDFLRSQDWICIVDGCRENEKGERDWKGKPVLLTPEQLAIKERQMGKRMFALQMMNDPLPEEMRAWNQANERFVKLSEVPKGWTVVLSDPAPKGVGSPDKAMEKKRSGDKDFWSIVVVRFVKRGQRLERYILDAIQYRNWTWDQGVDKCLGMMQKWGTRMICIEEGSQNKGMYESKVHELARKAGMTKPKFIRMKSFAKGKDWRHAQMAGLADSEELFFVKDVMDEGTLELLLGQCREHPQTRYDDLMDGASLCADPAVIEEAPKAEPFKPTFGSSKKKSQWKRRTRYVY